MKVRQIQKMIALVVMIGLSVTPALAQSNDKKLDDKNNPLLIGKRDINKGQLTFYSIDKEVALGRQLAAEVDRSTKFVTDPLITEYVNRVGQNLVLHSDAKVPFTIKVIDSNDVNAFALPGGFLYVNRGLMEAADNEAEVAGVLAHEIAHVTARHGIEQASKGQLLNYASIPLIFFGGIGGYIIQQVAAIAVPLTFLKFSRGAEKEADRLGAQYMWASGYDPNALITFFEKLQVKDKKKPGTIAKVFSTHPLTGDRIKEVNDLLKLFPDRAEYQVSSSEFNDVKSRVIASSAASRSVGSGNDRRPTLKRRGGTSTDDPADDTADRSAESNRPVLKRRDSSSDVDPNTAEPTTSGEPQRPVLKRREGGNEQTDSSTQRPETPADKPAAKPADKTIDQTTEKTSETTGRPTLKRRTDTNN